MLQPGRNVWRVEPAKRAAMLVDAAALFGAVRASMLKAKKTIFVVGWDIDSRTPLVGEERTADDGLPVTLGPFLCALVERNPDLNIYLLLWDYSLLYTFERELFPQIVLDWNTPHRVHFCLDRALPVGSSQHQKIVVVDDTVAYSGGLDLTIRRWDTSDHALKNPLRIDPAGEHYDPFHDVQAVVDGEAAAALAQIVRERWECADGGAASAFDAGIDAWPDQVEPDFKDVGIGIARTIPKSEDLQEVREVEQLFFDMIDCAQREIYIENQFLTSAPIANRLARRLQGDPDLQVVIIAPGSYGSWVEERTMRNGRIRFRKILEKTGAQDRFRMLYPCVEKAADKAHVMIHSKVTIIDDKILRIGSANLNNRSMGADTECDLVIEAKNEAERDRILALRNRLLADHCGTKPEVVAAHYAKTGSLVALVDQLGGSGHELCVIDDGDPDPEEFVSYIEGIADPPEPLLPRSPVQAIAEKTVQIIRSKSFKFIFAAVVLLALTLAWQFTPLSEYASPNAVSESLRSFADRSWAPFAVIGGFVAGGLIAFPLTIMIAATAAAFGPWFGLLYAAAGAMASALITYGLGVLIGKESLREILGPKLNKLRQHVVKRGVLAVAAIRLVPLAPFTVVNLAAGASEIRLTDYLLGTLLGLAPGLVVLSAMGHQIMRIIEQPTVSEVAMLVAAVIGWLAVAFGAQALISRLGSRAS